MRVPGLTTPLGIDEGGMTLIGADWLRLLIDGGGGSELYAGHWIDRPPAILLLYGVAELVGGSIGVRVLGCLAAIATAALAGSIAARVRGSRSAWLPAALLTGALLSAPSLDGDRTPGELLASTPATAAILLLVGVALADAAGRAVVGGRRFGLLVLAGASAAFAPLVKQSALDPFLAATAWLLVRGVLLALRRGEPGDGPRRMGLDTLAGLLGAAVVTALAVALVVRGGSSFEELWYALYGFRVDVLAALAEQGAGPFERAPRLLLPALGTGILFVAVVGVLGILRTARRPRGLVPGMLLLGWFVGSLVGIAGGGYYWTHYLLQLAAPAAVGSALALAGRHRIAMVLVAYVAACSTAQVVEQLDERPLPAPDATTPAAAPTRPKGDAQLLAVAEFVQRNSLEHERIVTLYARANLPYHADREPATPFAWSSMYRAMPQARSSLLQALTGPERAGWVVTWQRPTAFGMDRDGAIRAAIRDGYRRIADVCGKPVYVRPDRAPANVVLPSQRCAQLGPERVYPGVRVTRARA